MSEKTGGALMIAGMVVSWASYYAASKLVVVATGSPLAAGLLLRSAAFVFLTIQLVAGRKFLSVFRQGKTAIVLMAIGVFGYLLDLFANLGYAHGSLGTGTALLKTDVLMVNIATVIIYKKKLYVSDWVGTLTMLAGVLMVLGINFKNLSLNVYDLFFIASALCVTINAFIIKAAQDKFHADTDMIAYYNNFVVLMLFLISSLAVGDVEKAGAGLCGGFPGVVVFGGLAQALIYYFYYRNLRRLEVWKVKLWLLLMPVVSCFIGVVFLKETLSVGKVAGIGVVLAGAAVVLLRGRLSGVVETRMYN